MAYEASLAECAKAASWARAVRLLDLMNARNLPRERVAWTSAAAACGKAGRVVESLAIAEAMEKKGIRPDQAVYHSVLEACDAQGDAMRMAQLLDKMSTQGIMPNVVTYHKVLVPLVQAGLMEEAMQLYRQASKMGVFNLWSVRGRFVDLEDIPIEVAQLAIRDIVEDKADQMVGTKAGKGGFFVLTGPAKKTSAHKQQAILSILRECGLKARVDPAKFGRLRVRFGGLQRLGQQRQMAGEFSGFEEGDTDD